MTVGRGWIVYVILVGTVCTIIWKQYYAIAEELKIINLVIDILLVGGGIIYYPFFIPQSF